MPNYLRDIVTRPLRGELAPAEKLWDHTNAGDISDEDVWRDLAEIGTRTPLLVAYEDSYRGWYLAFADGADAQVIFLEPDPELDPDVPLIIPSELVDQIAPDLADALGEHLRDILETLEEVLYVNGRNLRNAAAWQRVLATLAAANASPGPIILSDQVDGGRRYVWRDQKPTLVSHRPEPDACWNELRKLLPHDDAERLFREMYFRK